MRYINRYSPSLLPIDMEPINQILVMRGLDETIHSRVLNPEFCDFRSPFELTSMMDGILLLIKAVREKRKFFLQVDSDTDGITSSAMLYLYLKEVWPDIDITWRVHEGKQHGIIMSTIPDECDFILVPDAGSNQAKEFEELAKQGKQVLVIDHHQIEGELSDKAIVINNQIGDYHNRWLSGAGVTLQFCRALDEHLGICNAKNYFDLAAVGIIADSMNIDNPESRYIIKTGLNNIKNPALKAFIKEQAYSIKKINPIAIAFYVAPLINAMIRVGKHEEKETLFRAFIEGDELTYSTKRGCSADLETVAEQNARQCSNARSRQKTREGKMIDSFEMMIHKNDLLSNRILVITTDQIEEESMEGNLTGLIASKFAGKYNLPTLVLKDCGDTWKGSARNTNSLEFPDLKTFCLDSGFVEFAQGK